MKEQDVKKKQKSSGENFVQSASDTKTQLTGEIVKRLVLRPVRILFVITGISLVRGILTVVLRYLFGLKNSASVEINKEKITISSKWTVLGKSVKISKIISPLTSLTTCKLEERKKYLGLVAGFAGLVTGTFFGVGWLADGLHAGYPYLVLAGALTILAGAAIDIILYLFVPGGKGKAILTITIGNYNYIIKGVDTDNAHAFLNTLNS